MNCAQFQNAEQDSFDIFITHNFFTILYHHLQFNFIIILHLFQLKQLTYLQQYILSQFQIVRSCSLYCYNMPPDCFLDKSILNVSCPICVIKTYNTCIRIRTVQNSKVIYSTNILDNTCTQQHLSGTSQLGNNQVN